MDRFAFDARWKYAAGELDFDYPGFVHTGGYARPVGRSNGPDRIFETPLDVARQAGLEGELRARLARDDDHVSAGKPVCDYDDAARAGGAGGRVGP